MEPGLSDPAAFCLVGLQLTAHSPPPPPPAAVIFLALGLAQRGVPPFSSPQRACQLFSQPGIMEALGATLQCQAVWYRDNGESLSDPEASPGDGCQCSA